jgi:hypothetical protein
MITEIRKLKIVLNSFLKIFFIFSFINISGVTAQTDVLIGIKEPNTDVYRVLVVKAKSMKNAKTIAERLHKITNKPVYINSVDGDFIIQVGGISDIDEANSIIKLLESKGIKNLSIVEGSEFKKEDKYSKSGERKKIYVKKINSSVKIDGVLDESEWKESMPSEGFIQQEPIDGAPSTEKTVVRVIRDDMNIYFGITCYDSEPDKIIANEMRRDAQLFSNDNVEIFIDTFNDKKNCYYFRTNPTGARYDAMITDEGKNVNYDWNTIWRSSSKISDIGWTAEIAIPIYAIRFKENMESWGINFGREIKRKNERTFWSYIPRSLGMSGKFRVSLCGEIVGLKELSKGKDFEIIPYVNGEQTREYTPIKNDSEFDGGIDVLYRITGNLRADLSYNTDFAQVEEDQEIVNVTRENILYPEKRDFFLENAGLFQFGDVVLSERESGGEGSDRITTSSLSQQSGYLLYHSRRIGIKENEEMNEEIPLFGGTKLAGKIGKNSIGLMNMQTKEKQLSNDITEPSTNYSVFRVKHDLLRNSNIGMLFLNKQSSSEKYNRALGIDANFPFTTNFTMGGSFAKSFTPFINQKDYAGTAFMDFKTDVFSWNIKYLNLEDNFNPEMGFVQRDKIRSTNTSATLRKWINKYGIRNIRFYTSFKYITDNENVLETKHLSENFYTTFSTGDFIGFGVNQDSDFLKEVDYIEYVIIPIGGYKYDNYHIFLNTDHGRLLSGGIRYNFGDYYDGIKRTFSPHFHFKPSKHFSMDTFYDYNHVIIKTGYFFSNVISSRITYMYNPDLYIKAYIQWNDLDRRLSSNILLHFIHNSTNNFYIVYNENRDPEAPHIDLRDRRLMFKFVYHLFL